MNRRSSGILFHLTSMPGPFGVGDMGPQAYRFVDFLTETRQSFWQILPLTPTDRDREYSPYHSASAFAGNPLLISPERLVADGLLEQADLSPVGSFPAGRVDFKAVAAHKETLLKRAYDRFRKRIPDAEFERFCGRQVFWLDDFVLFDALKSHFDGDPWNAWPAEIRDRDPKALLDVQHELRARLQELKFRQYLFYRQWSDLRHYCRQKHIQVIGDIPIYLPYDSVDVWVHPELFKLDEDKRPYVVSGVPPDYFSETGQLWGHPIYRWDALQKGDFSWWTQRLGHQLALFDVVRIDHFRGLVAYWEVPASEKTAINGKWVPVPIDNFLNQLMKHFASLPVIAEDLGIITPDVREIMCRYRLPGMRVLLFAFGEDFPQGAFLPHNHVKHCFIYTGTHDNNTARGWFEIEAADEEKKRFFRYIGHQPSAEEVSWELIRLALMSVANTAIIPMQDLLALGGDARMNDPSKTEANWHWRLAEDPITPALIRRLREMTETYGRI